MDSNITVGLFTLGGAAVGQAAALLNQRYLLRNAEIDRAHQLHLDHLAAQRTNALRWLDDRQAAHAVFLSFASALNDLDREAVNSVCWATAIVPTAVIDVALTAIEEPLARLELIAGEVALEAAQTWVSALRQSLSRVTTHWQQVQDSTEPYSHSEAFLQLSVIASEARARYVGAAREDLLTARSEAPT